MPTPSTGPTGRQPTATSLHLPPPRITYLTSRAVDTGRPGAATHLPPGPAALGLTPGLVGSPATVRPGTPQSEHPLDSRGTISCPITRFGGGATPCHDLDVVRRAPGGCRLAAIRLGVPARTGRCVL